MCFASCGKLEKEETVKNEIEKLFPESTFISVEETLSTGDLPRKIYTFENKGLIFEVDNYLYHDTFFGLKFSQISHNYGKVLEEAFKKKWEHIVGISGLEAEISGSSTGMRMSITVKEYDQIPEALKLYEEIYQFTREYLPKEIPLNKDGYPRGFYKSDFSVYFLAEKSLEEDMFGFYDYTRILDQTECLSMEAHEKRAKYAYIEEVRSGECKDSTVSGKILDSHPPFKLDKLFINGERFYSDRYPTEFFYDIESEQYYTIVCFGVDIEYNGGVQDYLQREILEYLYPDCNYKIKGNATTYDIGWPGVKVKKNRETYDLTFKLGMVELDIEDKAHDFLDYMGVSSGAAYFRYIPVDDFASLMKLEVENIDTESGAVYLKSRE